VKVGDLVSRAFLDVHEGYYQIMEIYYNSHRVKRLRILNLISGKYVEDIRPSHVKVLS